MTPPERLLRDLLKIGDAVVWSRHCHGLVAELAEGLMPEIEAARYETGLLYVRSLLAIGRHAEDLPLQANWILVARALESVIRTDLVRLTETALTGSTSPVRP